MAETAGARVQGAAARTTAAGTARLAFGRGMPSLEEQDRLGEGVVDFAARLAQTFQTLMAGRMPENLQGPAHERTQEDFPNALQALAKRREMIYDGAAELMRARDSWIEFDRADRDGPRHHNNPLWPLDALFGARDDVIEVGVDTIRDISTTHFRVTVDLVNADELLPSGIVMPEGPLRRLRDLPTEVWLDASGLARRIAIQNAAGNRQVWQVVEFWDFGIPVTIAPPDPSQITTPDTADLARIFLDDT